MSEKVQTRAQRGRPKNKPPSAADSVTETRTTDTNNTSVSNPPHPTTTLASSCPVCDTTTNRGGDVVQCDWCTLWYHVSCTNDNELPVTSKYNWYCNCCFQSHFPNFTPSWDISTGKWGNLSGLGIKESLQVAYDTIISWKPNLFRLPSGSVGKEFVEEITSIVNHFIKNTEMQSVAMQAIMVMGPLLLQKPSKNSKNKEHVTHLKSRLAKWKCGNIGDLINEGNAIQKRLVQGNLKPVQHEKVFVRLMLLGKVGAALKWVSSSRTGVHDITPEIISQLEEKHPESKPPTSETLSKLTNTELPKVEPVIFDSIDEQSIEKAAKSTKGAAGPSGMDSDMWRRIICSRSYGQASEDLRYSLALLTRKLCTELVDPYAMQGLLACRLIPLMKSPAGVRPIGIGEVLRRIIGKTVASHIKPEVIDAAGPLQLSAGQDGGAEAAVHAMRKLYEDEDSEGMLLVDASNAYNSLNRTESLLQIQHTCPEFAVYLINTYRIPCKLFISNSKGAFILSKEGTTQGDNTASGFYALGITPLITILATIQCSQIWYADDAGATGTLDKLKEWWELLNNKGPQLGYFPEASKSWLVVKPSLEEKAKQVFAGTGVKITSEGRKYLGSPIGTKDFVNSFVSNMVADWIKELLDLTQICKQEPQVCYAAYVFGLSKRWLYLMRTTPEVAKLFDPLECCISEQFLPTLFKSYNADTLRKIIALPAKFGGLSIFDPAQTAPDEYKYSTAATEPLVKLILEQKLIFDAEDMVQEEIRSAKASIATIKSDKFKHLQEELANIASLNTIIKHQSQKGASLWLTTLPVERLGFVMNSQEFQDALCLRYNLPVKNMPPHCACGKPNSVDHALCCMKGGYTVMRHNNVRDTEAALLREVCKDVTIEPPLIPSEELGDRSSLDVGARGLWSGLEKTMFDVRIFHPGAPSYQNRSLESIYKAHEKEKKDKYLSHVLNKEKCSFTPLVFSTHGGCGPEALRFHKRLATLISKKRNILYSDAVSYVRRRIRFSILRTTLIALRGYRGKDAKHIDASEEDLNLIPTVSRYEHLV